MTQRTYFNENGIEAKAIEREEARLIEIDLDKVGQIIYKYNCEKGMLISILHDIQDEYNYLPKEVLVYTSERLNLPLIQVYRVVTFFKEFKLEPVTEASVGDKGIEGSVKGDYLSKFSKNKGV